MAKRSAGSDLNHENWDQEEESEEAGTFTTASEDVLKDRVIKKAKRRGVGGDNNGPSVFAGFGGFKSASTGGPTAAGAFSFLSSGEKNTNGSSSLGGTTAPSFSFTNPDLAKGADAPKPAATGFTFGAAAAASGFTFGKKSDSEPVKTGFTFGKTSSPAPTAASTPKPTFAFGASSEASPKAAFSFGAKPDAIEKPKAEEKKATETSSASAQPSLMDLFKPKPGTWVCSVCDVSNAPDKNECVACSSPKPGGVPAAPAAVPEPAAKKWECPSCMVFNEAAKTSCVCCETPKPGTTPAPKPTPSFGSGTVSGSGFKFGSAAPAASSESTFGSGFKFGSTASTTTTADTAGSGFKFGAGASNESPGTGFKFGSSAVSKTSETSSPKSTGFQFGSSATKSFDAGKDGEAKKTSESPANASSDEKDFPKEFLVHLKTLNCDVLDWIKTHVSKTPHIYLTPVFKDYERHLTELKTKFNIGQTSTLTSTTSSSSSSSSTTAASVSAPASTFGTSSIQTKPVETSFKFGNGSTASTSPAFSFGAANKSEFSFGGAASAVSEPAKTGSEPAKTGFSFGTFGSGGSTFGSFGSTSTFSAAAAKATVAKKDDEGEEDESDEPPKVEVTPIEEKDSLHSVRCKLFYKKGAEFTDKGLGMLHLKPVDGSKKTQLLVRAETSLGNILLNIMLNKQMSLLKRGNNLQFVCVPNPPIPGIEEGPITMLVKVKNAEMADELEKKMKERIQDE